MAADFAERRWSSADGLSLYARDYPAAARPARLPVICIHGLTRNSRDFEDVAPWIAASGRRVLALDVRGRGRSDRDPDPMHYQASVYARDVLALMDALGLKQAVFIGTSMGGLITMMLAAMRSRAVAGAVLNDVGPEIAKEGLARIASYAGKPATIRSWDDAAAYLKRSGAAVFPDFTEADWVTFARRSFLEDANNVPVLDYDPGIAAPFARRPHKSRSLIAWLLFCRLAWRRPVLLLRGELSDLLSIDTVSRMRRAAPSMNFTEVPRVGHAPLLNEPVAKGAIQSFLGKLP